MKQLTLNLQASSKARDAGIAVAEDHARSVHPGWKEGAYEMFKDWISGWPSGFKFLMEDFRLSASIRGLPEPPTNRAFGGIAVRARKEGLIKSNGQKATKSVTAHRCFASEWIKP